MIHRLLIAAFFCVSLFSLNAFCEVSVVDDSENFALLEEQQGAYEPPVARDNSNDYYKSNEPALARDDHESSNGNVTLLNKIQGLQQEVQELRGQLDMQAHDLKRLQDQQMSFYKDLDARLSGSTKQASNPTTELTPAAALTTSNVSPAAPSAAAITPVITPVAVNQTNTADEQLSYLAAYELIKSKRFNDALSAMHAFVLKYPHGGYTANAQYWLGELYMVKNDYPQAIEHFNIVLQEFPLSSKGAASLLKVGYAMAASGKIPEARLKLQEVIKNYPDTNTAQLATAKLNALKNQ